MSLARPLSALFSAALLSGCYADGVALVGIPGAGPNGEAAEGGDEAGDESGQGEAPTAPGQPLPEPSPYCLTDAEGDAPLPCELGAPSEVLEPVVAWVWTGPGGEDSVLTTPLVANLDDDNSDGYVDPCDTPDIVVAAVELPADKNSPWPPGHLHVLDGASGESRRIDHRIDAAVSPALGDLDGDGIPEIIATQANGANSPYAVSERRLIALHADGSLMWASEQWHSSRGGGAIAIADLDGDGRPEILAPTHVADAGGEQLWAPPNPAPSYSMPVAVNLDLEGELEVLYGATAYDYRGELLFNAPMVPQNRGSVAVANFDADDYPELYVQYEGTHGIVEHDGTGKALCPTGTVEVSGAGGYPVTIHNLDEDPALELAFGFGDTMYVLGVNGQGCNFEWSIKADMDEGLSSGTVFDFIGDGAPELLYTDRSHLRIFDEQANIAYQRPIEARESIAYPVVADVDGDGASEIVVVSSRREGAQELSGATVQVLQNSDDRFAPSRRIWNQHTYHHSNVGEDGRVPSNELPHWSVSNDFRSNRGLYDQQLCMPPVLSDGT